MPCTRRILRLAVALTAAVSLMPVLTPAAGAARAQCPVNALSGKPVEVEMWHSMNAANNDALQRLVAKFEAANPNIQVKLVNQTSYDDTFTKYRAGLTSGDLPDLVQLKDTELQGMIDSRSILPVQACVKADHYDLSDYVERPIKYYTVGKTLWGMPFNVSNPVLYYNKQAFQKAGLDPNQPPKTLDEVRAAAQKLVDTGTTKFGYAAKLDPWYLE